MTKEHVIVWLEYLLKEEHAKADSTVPSDTEIALGMAIEALKQPEIIRCKDCKNYKVKDYWVNAPLPVLVAESVPTCMKSKIKVDPEGYCFLAEHK